MELSREARQTWKCTGNFCFDCSKILNRLNSPKCVTWSESLLMVWYWNNVLLTFIHLAVLTILNHISRGTQLKIYWLVETAHTDKTQRVLEQNITTEIAMTLQNECVWMVHPQWAGETLCECMKCAAFSSCQSNYKSIYLLDWGIINVPD